MCRKRTTVSFREIKIKDKAVAIPAKLAVMSWVRFGRWAFDEYLERTYLLIIFRLVAEIVIVPPFSVTSPVSSTLWLM